jgi:alkylhydroperoxidase family enzyme
MLGDMTVARTLSGELSQVSSPAFRVLLDFSEKLTLTPEKVIQADHAAFEVAGVNNVAVQQGVLIIAGFNLINLVADALHFESPTAGQCRLVARYLHYFGYSSLAGPSIRSRNNSWFKIPNSDNTTERVGSLTRSTKAWVTFLRYVGTESECAKRDIVNQVRDKVLHEPLTVTSGDVADLGKQGYSQEDIFDLILNAAATAALLRLEVGLGELSIEPS